VSERVDSRAVLRLLLLLLLLLPSRPASAADVEQPVGGGRWYSQTGRPGEAGFALVDDGEARFWSEFRRLGGVDALGYPVSRRFRLDGFVVQATQRVIMQWRPECVCVYFVNVFDRMSELGHDQWLQVAKQTPRHEPTLGSADARLALLDERPAIKGAYFRVVGDPIQSSGYPTSRALDMGNHYALRAQRVVFQEWKEDVPWARAGQVTVALGGDMAKEVGLVPPVAALPGAVGESGGAIADAAVPRAPPPAVPVGAPVLTTATRAAPIAVDPAELLLRTGEAGPGARPIDDAPLDAAALAQGRPDPAAYLSRLEQVGFVRGHRRGFVRDAATDPHPTRRYVVASEVSLFRDVAAAQAFWRLDADGGWSAREPAIRLDRLPPPGLGDESVAFRVVSGDVAARGYMVLFRRANAVALVSVLSQVSVPLLDEAVQSGRTIDGRLARAAQP
jgi:hypothetical protein